MSRYQNGKVHKLVDIDSNEIIYIGSTTVPLAMKLSELKHNHYRRKASPKYNFDHFNPENMYIELIESCPCNNIEELKKKEGEIRRLHKFKMPVKQKPFKEILVNNILSNE